MLAYVLALAIALGSFAIYMAAFFFPEIHRKNDFIWSGLGLFYALVLWVCAGRITGGVLLGQVASVVLLGWAMTQNLQLRRQLTPSQQQTAVPSTEQVKKTVENKVANLSLPQRFSQLTQRFSGSATTAKNRLQQSLNNLGQRQKSETTPKAAIVTPETKQQPKVEVIDKRTPIPEQPAETITPGSEAEIEPALTEQEAISLAVEATLADAAIAEAAVSEPIPPHPPDPELVEAALKDAEEKHEPASPPTPDIPENPSPS